MAKTYFLPLSSEPWWVDKWWMRDWTPDHLIEMPWHVFTRRRYNPRTGRWDPILHG